MTRLSPASVATAARLLSVSARHDPENAEAATTVSAAFGKLQTGLGRWIGTASYNILFNRALGMTRVDVAFLDSLPNSRPTISEVLVVMNASDMSIIMTGLTELFATIIELLGRMIGHEMAIQLVEHLVPTDAGSTTHTEFEEPHNG